MRFIFLSLLALTTLCSTAASSSERRVTLMSYNLENLFDTKDNPAREGDNTYFPLAIKHTPEHTELCKRNNSPGPFLDECLHLDWNSDVLATKIRNLARVTGGFEKDGPDILAVQEVENASVLESFKAALPHGASYITLANRDDSPGRGINVGLLSRLPLSLDVPVTSTPIAFPAGMTQSDGKECSPTRNLTAFTLLLPDGETLTVYSVHFPSGGPALPCRKFVSETLAAEIGNLPQSRMVVVAGDTNMNCGQDDQRVIADVLLPVLAIPDETSKGCRAPGSSFFAPQGWSFLDLILVNHPLLGSDKAGAKWFADTGSFRTVISAPELQVRVNDKNQVAPMRFDAVARTGTSDHWPVAIDILRRK